MKSDQVHSRTKSAEFNCIRTGKFSAARVGLVSIHQGVIDHIPSRLREPSDIPHIMLAVYVDDGERCAIKLDASTAIALAERIIADAFDLGSSRPVRTSDSQAADDLASELRAKLARIEAYIEDSERQRLERAERSASGDALFDKARPGCWVWDIERVVIERAISQTRNHTEAANLLGISERTISDRLRLYREHDAGDPADPMAQRAIDPPVRSRRREPHRHREDGTFGAFLRASRKSAGLTVAAMASAVGVSTSTIGFWECDRTSPRPRHHEAIAAALKLEIGELRSAMEPETCAADEAN